ncbi:hypothetical protein BX666DRAFT_1921631 [Dichotomocladium elegans]|nr:hypothetical protein BX666DRAFT_1921631 [Dichotomocladium elegans]
MKANHWISKLFIIALTTACLLSSGATGVGIPSGDRRFNITSPLDHGVYVGGQILPITYVLIRDSSGLELNIYVRSTNVNATTVTVAQKADVSEDASSIVKIDNETHWQHSYNYKIPQTAPAGFYEVVFESVSGHVNTSIPIMIRPYTSSSANSPTYTGSPTLGPTNGNTPSNKSAGDGSINRAYLAPLVAVAGSLIVMSHLLF